MQQKSSTIHHNFFVLEIENGGANFSHIPN